MNILFHLTSPPPVISGTDAVYQETEALIHASEGSVINIFPFRKPNILYPKMFYGMHQLSRLINFDKNVDMHHLFYVSLYPFPYLRLLKKPIIYSVTAGIQASNIFKNHAFSRHIKVFIINNERDRALLGKLGIQNYRYILPGIDVSRFTYSQCPLTQEFVLLVGSAPWTRAQFLSKGIDILLKAASKTTSLRLVFLWRGLFLNDLKKRISHFNLTNKVDIINEKIDVNQLRAKFHATIVLAENSKLVKAYPHSLIESLAAGKPVMISQCIPMSDYISEKKCGVVIDALTLSDVINAIENVKKSYGELRDHIAKQNLNDFSQQKMLAAFQELYQSISRNP